jgi:hypothetical protein
MNPPADPFARLGEDLILLSVRPRDGKIMTARRIDYGLMGAELIRLAAAGRIEVAAGRIVVADPAATGDAELDAALLSLAGGRPPRTDVWVGLPRRGIREAYAGRLMSAGALEAQPGGRLLSPRRYRVAAPERAAGARSRLDAIAQSTGPQATVGQAALGGLASAIGLGTVLYPGRAGRAQRARLGQIARWEGTADSAGALSAGALSAATAAAVRAVTSAAVNGARSVAADRADSRAAGLHGAGIDWGGVDWAALSRGGPHGTGGHRGGGHGDGA